MGGQEVFVVTVVCFNILFLQQSLSQLTDFDGKTFHRQILLMSLLMASVCSVILNSFCLLRADVV